MTPIGESSSKSPRPFAKKRLREVETSPPSLSPQCNEKTVCSSAESIPLRASKISATTVEMYLRIKPVSPVTKDEGIYHILGSTTVLTRFPSFEGNGRNMRSARSSGSTGRRHAFTKIFGSGTSQAEMFERSIKHRVAEFLGGKSSTIMTYGTRDSGKTYTLFGTSLSPGIITRSIELVFSAINCTLTPWYKPTCRDAVFCLDETARSLETRRKERVLNERSMDVNQISAEARRSLENSRPGNADPDGCEAMCNGESMYAVWLSFAEIYNGNVYDLLDDAEIRSPLRLTADNVGRAYVCSLRKVYAIAALEACRILTAGRSRMSTAATASNPTSSRSHAIFTMKLLRYRKDRAADEVMLSTLTFCDLAGSTQFDTRTKRSRMREASNINNSLLVLGRCLKAVSQSQVAPFRESKLTRIFQGAISGQENLSLIVNVIFMPNLYFETQNTFNFCVIVRKLTDSHKGCERSCEFEETARSDSDAIASSSVRQTSEIAETADCIDSVAYKNIREQNRRLTRELEAAKRDILNREYAIRQELADHYSHVIEDLEATYKEHTKKIETEGHDLLKWSVKQVESLYMERIGNLMRRKKRKRGDSGDCIEDSRALYEELEAENAEVTAKVAILRETTKKLRKENKTIICEKNKCSFELALATEELKKFRQLVRAGIRKWGGNCENIGDNADCLMNNLEQLMDERVKRTEEEKVEVTNEYVRATEDKDAEDAASKAAPVKRNVSKSEDISNDTLMKETGRELLREEAYIVASEHRVQTQEGRLARQRLTDAKGKYTQCTRNEECKCDRYTTNTSFDDYTTDNSFRDNTLVSSMEENSSHVPYTNSSVVDRRAFDDETILDVPILFAAQFSRAESTKKKHSNISDVDRRSFFESGGSVNCNVSRWSDRSSKDDSGIESGLQNGSQRSTDINDNANNCENEDKWTQTCSIDRDSRIATEESVEHLTMDFSDSNRQNHEEVLYVAELFKDLKVIRDVIYALNEAACLNERDIIRHKCQLLSKEGALERLTEEERKITIKRGDLFKVVENKMQEYKREINKLTRKLKVKEGQIRSMSKWFKERIKKSKYSDDEPSSMRSRLNKAFNKCANEHLEKIESLEKEVLRKTLRINELDGKIAQMQYKFAKGYELFENVHDLEIIVNRCQRNKNELYRRLYECSEIQLTLEDKLKKLTVDIEERENEVISLKSEIRDITAVDTANNEKARDLSKRVTETGEGIGSVGEDLQRCEDLRKNVENIVKPGMHDSRFAFSVDENNTAFLGETCKTCGDNQDEITRLKMKLERKELEVMLLKSNTDATIQKYEIFMTHFQNEIEEKEKRLKIIADNSNSCDRSINGNDTLRSDSLKKNKPAKDEGQLEELETHGDNNSLTSNNRFVPENSNSEILNESLASNENSIISSDETDSTSIKFNDIEYCQTDSSVRSNVQSPVCGVEMEVNFHMTSSDIKDKKKMPDWMKVRRMCGKTALRRLSTKRTNINSDSETEDIYPTYISN